MPRTLRTFFRPGLLFATSLLAGAACGNSGEGLGIALPGSRSLVAQLFVDRDFNGVLTQADTVVAGIRVFLLVAGTQVDTVAVDTTDANGAIGFDALTPGRYAVSVDSTAALGDSLHSFLTPATVLVAASGSAPLVAIRLGYPTDDVAGVRASAVGRRVVTSGTVLAGAQSFGDTSAYLRDAGGALRLTNAQVTVGNFVAPGDSVRVLGTVALRDGQPVLDIARIVLLQPGTTSPSADTVTTSEAAAALAGARDADLVRIQASSVTDSATAGADYTVTVDDGSGPLVVVIDSVQGIPPTAVVPGDSLRVNGVLVPTGTGSWRLKPRVQADLTVY
ncbi:MAG: hypothetical protein IPI92_07730 [Gemmatimonadetes bacterium]|nr:hypothetical protein [Gemmatimonadota bacterium]MBK7349736.1 hypothetical protein [Gemmatimonadota bacterium]MBK7784367.1 hypothetical protein [Gemmatimonadota bacterium]MBK9067589.1 hypothetical protein [Gemmatimonadota bacterium]